MQPATDEWKPHAREVTPCVTKPARTLSKICVDSKRINSVRQPKRSTAKKRDEIRTAKNGIPMCSAVNRNGSACKRSAVPGMAVCRYHGGLTPKGVSSPHFKTGKYSTYLPSSLAQRYETALADPDLLSLNNEIALVDAMITGIIDIQGKSDDDKTLLTTAASSLNDALDLRRKLVAGEMRRLITLQGILTVDQAMLLVNAMIQAVQECVTDPAVMALIQDRLRALLYRPAPPTVPTMENETDGNV